MTDTIQLDDSTQQFYMGVAAGNKVLEAHADVPFPDDRARRDLYWFYVGALAVGEYKLENLDHFMLGATTRAPSIPEGDYCPECGVHADDASHTEDCSQYDEES